MSKAMMTQERFDALLPGLGRLAVDTIEIARVVLVQGLTQTEAASRYGMSRQRIHKIVMQFRAASHGVPAGWRRVEVWLPVDMAEMVEAVAERARSDYYRPPIDDLAA